MGAMEQGWPHHPRVLEGDRDWCVSTRTGWVSFHRSKGTGIVVELCVQAGTPSTLANSKQLSAGGWRGSKAASASTGLLSCPPLGQPVTATGLCNADAPMSRTACRPAHAGCCA